MQQSKSDTSSLAALVRVASEHGVDLTLESLRSAYVPPPGPLQSATLIAIAHDAGLDARSVHPKWRELPRLHNILPAIVRLKDGGTVVLVSVVVDENVGQVVFLENPERPQDEQVALDEAHFSELWTGEIVLVKQRRTLTDEDQPFGYPWLIGQVLREKRLFRDIAIASIIGTFLSLAPIFVMMIIIDRVLVNHSVSTLWVMTGVIAMIVIFDTALAYLRRTFIEVTATRIDGRLYLYMMKRLLALPMDYFERNPVGRTMSRLANLWRVRHFLTGQMFQTMIDGIMLVILVPILLFLSWRLSLFVFFLAAMIFIIIYVFLKPVGRAHGKVVQAEIAKSIYLTETVYGMRTVKALALESRRMKEWDVKISHSIAARHALGVMANYPMTLSYPFERLVYPGSMLIGAALALSDPTVAPGALMGFGMLATRTIGPLVQFAKLLQDGGEIRSAISQAAEVLNHPSESGQIGRGLRLQVYGNISFQNVDFRYTPGASLALNGVTINIRPGTIYGIMGRSGSGKTTITRLLQGLNMSYEGIIKIDGMDLREMDLRHLRTSIGVVAQENFLFTGTIRENIGMTKQNASFSEIVRAAQLAGAEEFIERLPRGYDTLIEEGGSNLSGGQRQRLAIARALVLDPPVMILDEATSALDAESEAIINANLLRIAQSRTIICVSHRLAMLVPADAILVMERGKVYDVGTHQELLHRCDIYKHMWYTQNRHSQPGSFNAPIAIAHSASA
jgi:ATP-binding cassette subfamily B protein